MDKVNLVTCSRCGELTSFVYAPDGLCEDCFILDGYDDYKEVDNGVR